MLRTEPSTHSDNTAKDLDSLSLFLTQAASHRLLTAAGGVPGEADRAGDAAAKAAVDRNRTCGWWSRSQTATAGAAVDPRGRITHRRMKGLTR